jgi:hypothetical protein
VARTVSRISDRYLYTHSNKKIDVAGEYIRSDLVEDMVGVPVHYDFQILDVTTCEPIVGVYFEIFSVSPCLCFHFV